jgi:hypothetical protein
MPFWRDLGIQVIVCGVVLGYFVAVIAAQPAEQPLWDRALTLVACAAMTLVACAAMTLWTATVGHALVLRVVARTGWLWTWPATVLALSVYFLVAAVLEGTSPGDLAGVFVFTMMFFCLPWGTGIFVMRALVEFVLVQLGHRRRQRQAGVLHGSRY